MGNYRAALPLLQSWTNVEQLLGMISLDNVVEHVLLADGRPAAPSRLQAVSMLHVIGAIAKRHCT